MVVVEIIRWPTPARPARGRVVEVLGPIDAPGVDIKIVLRKHGIPDEHEPEASEEARRLALASRLDAQGGITLADRDRAGRTDFRNLVTVTIDGEHARDFDDAVSIERLSTGGYRLGVHIADVSHYVREDSPLDRDAFERATSVYFPDRAVHMFPEELATGICSLRPRVDRLVQSCLMDIDQHGTVVKSAHHDGIIRTAERMTYTDVNAILELGDADVARRYEPLVPMFQLMKELFVILNARRHQRGSIDFDLSETEVVLDAGGLVEAILPAQRNIAHRIIEEFMLVANETVASYFEEQGGPGMYRIHEQPDPLKVAEFEEFVSGFGYSLGASEASLVAAALSAAAATHRWKARREARGLPDAANDAEGAVCGGESRSLRLGCFGIYALHLTDTPLSGPRGPPAPSGAAPSASHGRATGRTGRGAAGSRATLFGARTARQRCRARGVAVEEGSIHGRQGR